MKCTLSILASIFLFGGCINKSTKKTHQEHSYEHTSKLTKNIDINFISQSSIDIVFKDPSVKSLDLKLIHHNDEGFKTTLFKQKVSESQSLNIADVTDELESGTLAAILEGQDTKKQPFSKVTTYDIQYQSEIDDAKKRRQLKN